LSNNAHKVAEHRLSAPLFEGFVRTLGEAELVDRGKKLKTVVRTSCRQEFFRADHAEGFKQLRAKKVLTTVASSGGEVGDPRALSARERSQRALFSSSGCAPVCASL
jgi:hypothetical protein